jgi:membrane protein DedA with SNARE-associated domain
VNVTHLIATYGYLAVFLLVGLESLGIPLPGETALIAAGVYAGHTHRLSVVVIWLVATLGAVLGDNIGYLLGGKVGYRLVRRYGHKLRIDEAKLKVGRYAFDRYGARVVLLGRFVSVLRTYAAFLAGTNRMRWQVFLAANAAGGVVWAAIYAFSSYYTGSAAQRLSSMNVVLLAVALVLVVVAFLALRRKTNQLIEVAEAAYPGPLDG